LLAQYYTLLLLLKSANQQPSSETGISPRIFWKTLQSSHYLSQALRGRCARFVGGVSTEVASNA
jgi:hypothetical protein